MTIQKSKPPLNSNVNWQEWEAAAIGVKQTKALKLASVDWYTSHQFDVAVALHLPNGFRAVHGGSERAFQFKLRHFFTRLDRKILKSAHKKRHAKIPRYVTLEHSASLGWHMHALLSSKTSPYTREQLSTIIKLMWLQEFGQTNLKGFEPHMAWAEPLTGGYDHYVSKKLFGPRATAVFDEMNTVLETTGA